MRVSLRIELSVVMIGTTCVAINTSDDIRCNQTLCDLVTKSHPCKEKDTNLLSTHFLNWQRKEVRYFESFT